MPRRLLILLAALAVGGLFFAGLFVHGRVGGVLLLLTALVLAALTRLVWEHVRPKGRSLRILIIAAIAVGGAIMLVVG
ncbi:MAG TPA: DUF6703 family protein [Mycobacteriales bacterium]|nr:DUF6703 family protein [Mycobacteriales bacterium]